MSFSLDVALAGMMDARGKLQTREGVTSLPVLSENLQRLAAYTSAVEEHLADIEAEQERLEALRYRDFKEDGTSPTAAEREAKYSTAGEKAQIKKLTRLVNSSWRLVNVGQSRFNHIEKEQRGAV
jgi:hypothetical protein